MNNDYYDVQISADSITLNFSESEHYLPNEAIFEDFYAFQAQWYFSEEHPGRRIMYYHPPVSLSSYDSTWNYPLEPWYICQYLEGCGQFEH